MRTAYTISAVGHVAVLLWSVWSFAAKPLVVPPGDALPVDIVSVSEFTQMTQGNKSAPKAKRTPSKARASMPLGIGGSLPNRGNSTLSDISNTVNSTP